MQAIAPAQLSRAAQRALSRWLVVCLTLVAAMVLIGGLTRLTESGLSITQWKLLSGTLPPLSEAAWAAEFAQYQQSPQFQQVNAGFTLADFRQIFWLEYLHRLLGRIVGLAVIGGALAIALRVALPRFLRVRLILASLLVMAQGLAGWLMVKSGLIDVPRVAPLRLALHLSLAFALFSLLLWTRWQLQPPAPARPAARKLRWYARACLALGAIQIVLGALVAGLRAGHSYNTFPLMDGQWIPGGLHLLSPWWRNHLENVMTVQFQHRVGAIALALGAAGLCIALAREGQRRLAAMLAGAITVQFALGVATLLSVVAIALAAAHQLVALWLFATLLRAYYLTTPPSRQVLLASGD